MHGRKTSEIDVGAGGILKHKAKSEIDENGEEILKSEFYDPIGYDWMFRILRGGYREPEGAPIVRITKQMGEMDRVRIGIRGAKSGRCLGSVR